MKKIRLVICFLSVLILLGNILLNYDKSKLSVENTDALKFEEEYEVLNNEKNSYGLKYPYVEIDSNNPIKYSNASEISKIVESGTGIIYLGYSKCPWCRNVVPVLLHAVEDAGIDNIYYIDMYDERDSYKVDEENNLYLEKEGSSDYKKLLEIFNEYLDDYYVKDNQGNEIFTGEKRIYVPMVIFVREGDVIGIHIDTVESQTNPYKLLNDEQYEELYNIYSRYIHEMLNDLCDERC